MSKIKSPNQVLAARLALVPQPPSLSDRVAASNIKRVLCNALVARSVVQLKIGDDIRELPNCITLALFDAAKLVEDGHTPGVLHTTRLSSGDVAKLIGCSYIHVAHLTNRGLLPCSYTPGRHRRFTREDVETYLQKAKK
jgi:excisionase family DNA binding protein